MIRRKRVIYWFLTACLVVTLFPAAVFAAWEHGDTGSADFTKILIGKDGKEYYINENVKTLFYNDDGSKKVKPGNGRSKVRWRYLKISDKTDRSSKYGYCVEFGAGFDDQATYKAKDSSKDTKLFQNLPTNTQKMIAVILCYGRNGSRAVPVAGANDADYYFATQILVWEAQQGLRTIIQKNGSCSGTKLAASHSMPATHMFKAIKGRPAEKCYKWLEKKINDHLKIHSFTSEDRNKAPLYTMKYQKSSGKWSITLNDANKKASGFTSRDARIKVKKNGNKYTFETDKPIASAALIAGSNAMVNGSSSGKLLVWNCTTNSANQALIMGSSDLLSMYMKLKTESPSQVIIEKKDAETGKRITGASAVYKISDASTGKIVSDGLKTGINGTAAVPNQLYPGAYELKEIQAPKGYVLEKTAKKFTVTSSSPITVEQKDKPQKGVISISKTGETFDTEDKTVKYGKKPLEGVTFQILAAEDIITLDGTVRLKAGEAADTITTDRQGNAKSCELYLGKYNIVEKETLKEYLLTDAPTAVELKYEGQEIPLVFSEIKLHNELKKGGVEICKTDISTGEVLPDTGIEILNQDKKVILQTRTDKEGKAFFDKLPRGNYYFREFDAPNGYKIDERAFPFEIKENGEIIKCEMTNHKITKTVSSQPPKKNEHSPQTGDSFMLWMCIFLLIGASLVIFILVKKHKRY